MERQGLEERVEMQDEEDAEERLGKAREGRGAEIRGLESENQEEYPHVVEFTELCQRAEEVDVRLKEMRRRPLQISSQVLRWAAAARQKYAREAHRLEETWEQ